MACKRATPVVWMLVVAAAVAAIVVTENGRVCDAFDMGKAKDYIWNSAEGAYNKLSGKLSVNDDMTHKTGDEEGYVSGKVHAVSHSAVSGAKDSSDKFYTEAERDAGSDYGSLATKTVRVD